MPGEELALTLGLSLTAIVFAVFICAFIVIARKTRAKQTQQQSAATGQVELTAQQQPKSEVREFHKQSVEAKHELHQQDAKEHGHTGVEEHYEEIVGSLGAVNDEGCEDLSGVRFIAHDLAYDDAEGEGYDYTRLAQAMVLGDVINNPRFKKPYSRK